MQMLKTITTVLIAFSLSNLFAQNYTILGTGNHALNPICSINQITTDQNGNVYAACGYVSGGLGAGLVEKWNGTDWAELRTATDSLNADGVVHTIVAGTDNNIYAAGDFNDLFTGATGGFYVAKWDSSSWSEVNSLSNPHFNNASTFAITADVYSNIYASQYLDTAGQVIPYWYIAKWNHSSWSELGTANNKFQKDSFALSLSTDIDANLYVGGKFTDSNNYKYVAVWDGVSWRSLGTGGNALNANGDIISVVNDYHGNVYAAGGFTDTSGNLYVAKWDGTSWTDPGNSAHFLQRISPNSAITSMAVDQNTNLYVAGQLKDSLGFYVAKWDGTNWSKLHTDSALFNFVTVDASDNVYGAHQGQLYIGQPGNGFVARLNFTGVNGISKLPAVAEEIKIYPNPVNDMLHISSETSVQKIEIFNMLGERVMLEQSNAITAFNVSQLAQGIYLAKVYTETGHTSITRFCRD